MDNLMTALEQALSASSWVVIPLVYVGGAATGLSPCALPTFPVLIGYITGQRNYSRGRGFLLALTFVLGLAITYIVLGITASFVGSVLGLSKAGWMYLVAAVCVIAGLSMAGVINISFATLAPAQSQWARLSGYVGALVLGMLFGLVATPCAMPLLALILALIAQKGQMVYGSALMFTYAFGRGLPLLIIGTLAGALTNLQQFARYSVMIQRVGGWLLVIVGLYCLWIASSPPHSHC